VGSRATLLPTNFKSVGLELGKTSKIRGKSYEYRVADWFKARQDWEESFRIPLSGASERITKEIAGHDVLAQCSTHSLRIACECKKTGNKDKLRLERTWIEKLNYTHKSWDELLIFAFHRSMHYVMIPDTLFLALLGCESWSHEPTFIAKGKRFFTLHRTLLDQALEIGTPLFWWEPHDEYYFFMTLESYIQMREGYSLSCLRS